METVTLTFKITGVPKTTWEKFVKFIEATNSMEKYKDSLPKPSFNMEMDYETMREIQEEHARISLTMMTSFYFSCNGLNNAKQNKNHD